jgi:glycosyltransferase involved in cell wall biosynthesis
MRLAVFTSKFPHRVSTFFARDMRALVDAGIEVEIFPVRPLDRAQWRYVPALLGEDVLGRDRVHHIGVRESLAAAVPWPAHDLLPWLRDVAAVTTAAARYGPVPLGKSAYALAAGRAFARREGRGFDHVLSYWGNFPATSAYVFHRLAYPSVPFTVMCHAGTDLYRTPIFLRQKLLYADNVLVPCEFNRAFLRERHAPVYDRIASKVHVHHLGLDLSEYRLVGGGRAADTLLAVGSFDGVKGFDYLLRAAAALRRAGVPVTVELVGDGPEAGALRALARRLGIGDAARFRGWLEPAEVRAAMERATLLVHPSAGLGDAVPTVIKEAIAVGTPVVASNVAGIPELLDHGRGGVLVPPRDVDALAGAIARLLRDGPLRDGLATHARAYAERMFDLRRTGAALATLLRATRRGPVRRTA